MSISPVNLNMKPQTIENFSKPQRFVRGIELRGLAPLILLESFVTGGRTIQAHKRGGFDEARERLTEESIGAAFWFAGVKVFNKMNDFLLSKLMGIKNTNFDAQSDAMRDPCKNYMNWAASNGQKISKNKIVAFKSTKIISSIILANALVGFVVPRLNQAITRSMHKNDKPQVDYNNLIGNDKNLEQFTANKKANKNVSFTGFADALLNFSQKLEHDTTYQLLSTDAGIAGGRAISARNKNERIEILWRDLSSIYFYMFNMAAVSALMNKIQHGRPTRLNPVGARQVTDYMKQVLSVTGHHDSKAGTLSIKPQEFAQIMLGDLDVSQKMAKVKPQFNNGAVTLDKFLETLQKEFTPEEFNKYSKVAKRMSKLQPKLSGVAMLSESQAEAIFKGGALNNPKFWDNVFTVAKGTETQTVVKNGVKKTVVVANHKNPYKFVAQKDLDKVIENIRKYVKSTIKKAEKAGSNIDVEMLENAYKNNMFKNALNWGTGFAISALFLSTIIPKIQYWITKKRTGSDEFPGVAEYSKK